jgi:hypothetical protein
MDVDSLSTSLWNLNVDHKYVDVLIGHLGRTTINYDKVSRSGRTYNRVGKFKLKISKPDSKSWRIICFK